MYPRSTFPVERLFVVAENALPCPGDLITLDTLAGGLARRCPEVYRVQTARSFYRMDATPGDPPESTLRWLRELRDEWGVTLDDTYIRNVYELVATRAECIDGYVRIASAGGEYSWNDALTVCARAAPKLIVACASAKMVEALRALGIAEADAPDDTLDADGVCCRVTTFQPDVEHRHRRHLGEFSVFSGCSVQPFAVETCAAQLRSNQPLVSGFAMGWGPEATLIAACSRAGVGLHASDWALNLSALNAGALGGARQPRSMSEVEAAVARTVRPGAEAEEEDVHYVAFLMTDGDNVQWLLNDFCSERRGWFGSAARRAEGGEAVPIGWTIPAALSELAPCVVEYLHRTALPGGADSFVAGPSGRAYVFPDLMPRGALEAFVVESAVAMARCGVAVATLIFSPECGGRWGPGSDALRCVEVYLAQDGIDAVIAFTWGGGYAQWSDGGGVSIVAGKVVVRPRLSLWGDRDDAEDAEALAAAAATADDAGCANARAAVHSTSTMRGVRGVVRAIGARARGRANAGAYSLVPVHAWTHDAASVARAAAALRERHPHVRVVSPNELVERIRRNVGPAAAPGAAGAQSTVASPLLSLSALEDLAHGVGHAEGGGWACDSTVESAAGHMCFGPRSAALPPGGAYTACFALALADCGGAGDGGRTRIANLDVYDAASNTVLAELLVTRSEFKDDAAAHRIVALEFDTAEGGASELEFRVWWYGTSHLLVERVAVFPGAKGTPPLPSAPTAAERAAVAAAASAAAEEAARVDDALLPPAARVRATETRAELSIHQFLDAYDMREAGRYVGHKSGSRGSTASEARSRGKAEAGIMAGGVHLFLGQWDEEGVWVYQAFCDEISDWALEHQRFGGPHFKPERMTWVKPSFAWILYRSGYSQKRKQERVLKIKVSHAALGGLLSRCAIGHGGGGTLGRIQWDPARDLLAAEKSGKEPRKLLRRRAIQIGLKGRLSVEYVDSVIAIVDVTALARRVGEAHAKKKPAAAAEAMAALLSELPHERPYMPRCSDATLAALRMRPTK